MQPDRERLVGYWLSVAEQDLRLAEAHAEDEPNVACFHAQQAGEKALKALLVRVAGDAARTHVAAELIAEIEETGEMPPGEVRRAAVMLDRYYTGTRYPDAMGDADPTASYFEKRCSGRARKRPDRPRMGASRDEIERLSKWGYTRASW